MCMQYRKYCEVLGWHIRRHPCIQVGAKSWRFLRGFQPKSLSLQRHYVIYNILVETIGQNAEDAEMSKTRKTESLESWYSGSWCFDSQSPDGAIHCIPPGITSIDLDLGEGGRLSVDDAPVTSAVDLELKYSLK